MIAILSRTALVIALSFTPFVPTFAPLDSVAGCEGSKYHGSSLHLPLRSSTTLAGSDEVFPVLFVHGFTDTSESWTKPASVTWSAARPAGDPKSFVQWVNEIPGALPALFDYRDNSLEWVTHDAIGKGLADAIDCLASRSGQQVAVVAHSMGGLATREALSDPARAKQVSLVVTIGTPNLGSFWPNVISAAADTESNIARWVAAAASLGAPAVDRAAFQTGYLYAQSLIVKCAERIARTPASGVCGDITPIVGAMKSHAGEALAAGSQQLADLDTWPDGVAVHAFASNYVGFGTDAVAGDGVVPPHSAIAGAPQFTATRCDLSAPLWERQADQILGPTACFHPVQPANLNVVALVLTKLRDDVAGRRSPVPGFFEPIAGKWSGGSRSLEVGKDGRVAYDYYIPCYKYTDSCTGAGPYPDFITVVLRFTRIHASTATGTVESVTPSRFPETTESIPRVGQTLTLTVNDRRDRIFISDYGDTPFCKSPEFAGSTAYC